MRGLVVVVVDSGAGERLGEREGDLVVRRRVARRLRRRGRRRRRRLLLAQRPRRRPVAPLREAVPERPGGPAAEEEGVDGRGDHPWPEAEVEAVPELFFVFVFESWAMRKKRREKSKERRKNKKKLKEEKTLSLFPHPGLMFLASSSSCPTHDSRRTLS